LTALGVGSLAVGLALQDTLANLFAGFYLVAFRQIRIGDFVELERGIGYGVRRGTILDIGWRTSRMRTASGQLLVVPNSIITQSYILSYTENDELTVPVEVQVSPKEDLAETENAAIQVAEKTLARLGVRNPSNRASVRFASGRDPLVMTVTIRIPSTMDQTLATHEIVKAMRAEFSREEVEV
jgi:small-conductance mechanosensitive channel